MDKTLFLAEYGKLSPFYVDSLPPADREYAVAKISEAIKKKNKRSNDIYLK